MAVPLLVVGLLTVSVATVGTLGGVEPFATWYYPLAWYGTLAAGEAVVRVRTGEWYLLSDGRFAAAAFGWSVPFWLLFELLNFRVRNWYYVFVPDQPVARWTGIVVSFATVLPAILLSQRLLETRATFRDRRTPPFRVAPGAPAALQWSAVGMVALSLAWPRIFFPLVWGAMTLLLDPWVYRREPARSLLGRLAAGRPGLPLRLLLGGLGIGVLWEAFNWRARGKWIYTVPGLEELRLFEMPLAGFLGFPVLALDGWAAWQTLVLLRVAPDSHGDTTTPGAGAGTPRRLRAPRLAVAGVAAALLSATVLAAMGDRTITSVTPRLHDMDGIPAARLSAAGFDVFSLAEAEPGQLAQRMGVPTRVARRWVEAARLVALRGIGARNAEALRGAGIATVEELAGADPQALARRLRDVPGVTPARVRVWVRAARSTSGR